MREIDKSEICLGKYTSLELVDENDLQEVSWKINKFEKRIEKLNRFIKDNARTMFKTAAVATSVCCTDGETIAEVFAVGITGAAFAGAGSGIARFGEWRSAEKALIAFGFCAGVIFGAVKYSEFKNFFNHKEVKAEEKKQEINFNPAISNYYQSHLKIN